MLDYICLAFILIVLFLAVSFILVKLYEHGVRSWLVQSIVCVAIFFYFSCSYFEHIYLEVEKWISFVIVLASIFVVDNSSNLRNGSKQSKSASPSNESYQESGNSALHYIADAFLIYYIWSCFTSDNDNDDSFL